MRRFVQSLSARESLPALLPESTRRALLALPDRYNIGSGGNAGVLRCVDGHWDVAEMRWGFVPSWEAQPSTAYSTLTARLDRAPTSRMYRRAWRQRRCVVPMNGYYKWDRQSKPRRPYFIQRRDGQLLFALGLWARWGDAFDSFALLTFANDAIPSPLTPDGPVFLPPEQIGQWFDANAPGTLAFAQSIRQPALEAYPVSRRVADRKRDDYFLLEPADVEPAALESMDSDEDE
jgi:putative SOS response-associated peptidase YedK